MRFAGIRIRKMLLGLCLVSGISQAATLSVQEITLRHALDGKAQDALATLVMRFNDSLKGKGKVVLQDARSVENKQQLPTLALLDVDDSVAFFDTRPRFMPLSKMMRDGGQPLNTKRLYPQMLDAVDDDRGQAQALPMGMSLPVLLINRAMLPQVTPVIDLSPRTWLDVQNIAGTLYDHGIKCPLTSSRFAWVHLENMAAQHGEQIEFRNGRIEKIKANSLMNVKHLALLASWQKSRYFHYFGPDGEGSQRFLSGECAMLTGESSLYIAARAAGMEVTIAPLPYYDDAYGAQRERVLPDGAALWGLAGHKKAEYQLAARFVAYLLRPEVQKDWVRASGSLPMTPGVLAALRESGMPAVIADAADRRLAVSRTGSTRARPGPLRDRLRKVLGEEVALVWSTPMPAKEALDITTLRANEAAPSVDESIAQAVSGKVKRRK
jgi:sn-glycerol 3-phosphate transport system substrate-binding protein